MTIPARDTPDGRMSLGHTGGAAGERKRTRRLLDDHDTLPTRAVVSYADVVVPVRGPYIGSAAAIECGHEVACTREPGGRKVVPHVEPCEECRLAQMVADSITENIGR